MFGMSSISSAVSSAQLSLYQARLQQARRDAAQAQDNVRALEAQTDEARQKAAQAQDDVNTLESRPPRPQATLNTSGQFTGALLNATA
jgi:multidrug resistance efflux pump